MLSRLGGMLACSVIAQAEAARWPGISRKGTKSALFDVFLFGPRILAYFRRIQSMFLKTDVFSRYVDLIRRIR